MKITSLLSTSVLAVSLSLGGCMAKNNPKPMAPNGEKKAAKQPAPAKGEAPKAAAGSPEMAPAGNVWGFTVKTIDGSDKSLKDFDGKAVLIVNTASQCGYTGQYKDLQQIYTEYKSRGFEVLAFPSNDFGGQEPGSNAEIKTFCTARYKTTFPLFAKVKVKGDGKVPLYSYLTEKTSDGIKGEVGWNFTKFLVSPKGDVVARFASGDVPTASKMRQAIEKTLPN